MANEYRTEKHGYGEHEACDGSTRQNSEFLDLSLSRFDF